MASMTYPISDHIPITRTFVQSGTTTAIALVGQVLDNGKTNWIGYDEGSAYYILPSSTANAETTSLDDGMTYYISEGNAPGGYLATSGSGASSSPDGTITSSTSQPSETGDSSSSTSNEDPSSTMAESSSASESAATTTTSGSAMQVASPGGIVSVVLGILAWFI